MNCRAPSTDIFERRPIRIEDGISVFSHLDDYTSNYETIAADHLAASSGSKSNPWIDEGIWEMMEASTVNLVRKYSTRVRSQGESPRILDVGVGLGRLLTRIQKALGSGAELHGMDISLNYLKVAKQQHPRVVLAKIEDMPYQPQSFDIVTCTDVLEHVLDLNHAISRILSVIKPGGYLIVRVPNKEDLSPYLKETYPYGLAHLRAFDEWSARLLFEKVMGVRVLEVVPTDAIPSKSLCKYNLPLPMFRDALCVFTKASRLVSKRLHGILSNWLFHSVEINLVIQAPAQQYSRLQEVGKARKTPTSASTKPLNILLLCNRPSRGADASTVTDHLNAFVDFSRHRVTQLSFLRRLPALLNLERFDVIVIHYSIAIGYLRDHYINAATQARVRAFDGLKVVFIQDEYRSVHSVWESLENLRADVLFTCVPEGEIEKVYPEGVLPQVTKVNTLTGYVPQNLVRRTPCKIADRPIDVGYRSRKPPFWLGRLGYEKREIASTFIERAKGSGLKIDISCEESDRIYGAKWIDFVSSCKVMLGAESGASVFDFTGGLQKTVDEYTAANPGADFEAVHREFLQSYEGKIKLNQISPRCFEAAALGTAMVLYEGEYSGILKPGRHYIALKKDFSNFDEVVELLKDSRALQEMADRTRAEIALNPDYSYRSFIEKFDTVIEAKFAERNKRPVSKPYGSWDFNWALLCSPRYCAHRFVSKSAQHMLLATGLRRIMFRMWEGIPLNTRSMLRPLLHLVGR
jgi:2-polyprenyl-3-methyl-5-hydroxy-6-metoxy-1,4-benzoquinol methylase